MHSSGIAAGVRAAIHQPDVRSYATQSRKRVSVRGRGGGIRFPPAAQRLVQPHEIGDFG